MEIKAIYTEADFNEAVKELERLDQMDAPPGSPDFMKAEVLAVLADAYQNAHWPIDPPHPIDAIKFRMEQQGLTRKDLVPFIGTTARVSEILNGHRALTLTMIRKLHKGLGIPLESLTASSRRRRRRAA